MLFFFSVQLLLHPVAPRDRNKGNPSTEFQSKEASSTVQGNKNKPGGPVTVLIHGSYTFKSWNENRFEVFSELSKDVVEWGRTGKQEMKLEGDWSREKTVTRATVTVVLSQCTTADFLHGDTTEAVKLSDKMGFYCVQGTLTGGSLQIAAHA